MAHPSLSTPLRVPSFVRRRVDQAFFERLQPSSGPAVDFSQPWGEDALVAPDSIAWQVFKNPVALYIGGVAAVILELAEPSVRAGVWDHSTFRTDPVTRLQRTGLAAMVTVYGARSKAEAMIASVGRAHRRVTGMTSAGKSYRADDVELLNWVQATASFGFVEAYRHFVHPLSEADVDRFYAEAGPAARCYGALQAPACDADRSNLFETMRPRLEASPTIFAFLDIVGSAAAFPRPLRALQRLLTRAAVDITPAWLREDLGLKAEHGLRPWERPLIQRVGRLADRLLLPSSPAVQSCRRLGLPDDYLYDRHVRASMGTPRDA